MIDWKLTHCIRYENHFLVYTIVEFRQGSGRHYAEAYESLTSKKIEDIACMDPFPYLKPGSYISLKRGIVS